MMVDGSIWWPLLLSTLAGLSTTIGAVLAITRVPNEATLAFLLGTAIGVMATVSGAELWWHKAMQQQNWPGITLAVAAGAVCFTMLDPLLPKPPEPQQLLLLGETAVERQDPDAVLTINASEVDTHVKLATAMKRPQSGFAQRQPAAVHLSHSANGSPRHSAGLPRTSSSSSQITASTTGELQQLLPLRGASSSSHDSPANLLRASEHNIVNSSNSISNSRSVEVESNSASVGLGDSLAVLQAHHSGLMRLGLLMAVTMSLHNLPEGCAVAFSAFTDFGVMMALAIAVHNIPEGLIIAVPVYAATNSKAKAIGLAAASGLSEPLGALIALFILRPFVTSVDQLDYVLAFVGGVMLAVCGMELWPEARKCRQDLHMMQGILLGSLVMGWTLYVGV